MERARTQADPNVPFLPPEIYLIIAKHVCREDLPNYRLASTILAEAGKAELFHTLKLRVTGASVARLRSILEKETLSRLVHLILWDVSLRRVGTSVRDWHEWTRHCESRARNVEPEQSVMYKELSAKRSYWEAYLSRLEDEKTAAKAFDILVDGHPFFGLPMDNLEKVHLVMAASQLDQMPSGGPRGPAVLPVTKPLNEWRGDTLSSAFPLSLAIAIATVAGSPQGLQIDDWEPAVLDLLFSVFRMVNLSYKIVKLTIRFSTRDTENYPDVPLESLATALAWWCDIETLSLIRHACGNDKNRARAFVRTIDNTFEIKEYCHLLKQPACLVTLPKLHTLSLAHFNSTPKALMSLVARHSSTLRDLGLCGISLDPGDPEDPTRYYSWLEVFEAMEATTELEKMTLSGVFRNSNAEDDVWDFNNERIAKVVADFIVDGKKYPSAEILNSI